MRALVVVPTYNERENIGTLIRSVAGVLLREGIEGEILVVDDASPDGTGDIADEFAAANDRVHVLHRPGKSGLGPAYRAGLGWGLEQGYDVLVEMDADLSHDPAAIGGFLAAVESHDLVLGSRYLRGVTVLNWSMSRLLLSYFANRYASWITGLPFTDVTSGFKCYRRRVLEAIEIETLRSQGYAFQIETTFRAWRRGFRVGEIGIVFSERAEGRSKMSGRIVREAAWMVWKLRLLQLLGRR